MQEPAAQEQEIEEETREDETRKNSSKHPPETSEVQLPTLSLINKRSFFDAHRTTPQDQK